MYACIQHAATLTTVSYTAVMASVDYLEGSRSSVCILLPIRRSTRRFCVLFRRFKCNLGHLSGKCLSPLSRICPICGVRLLGTIHMAPHMTSAGFHCLRKFDRIFLRTMGAIEGCTAPERLHENDRARTAATTCGYGGSAAR